MQGFLVVVTGRLAPGQLPKFIELFQPVVSWREVLSVGLLRVRKDTVCREVLHVNKLH